jgi:glucose/arabinose dehydrogenase
MTGLDNPRGLAWGPAGGLYVAEAGRGGSGVCVPAPDAPPPAVRCYGATGAVSRLWHGLQERVVAGLPPGQAPTLYAWNLSALTDLAFGPDGSLYALRFGSPIPGVPFLLAGPGEIWRVPPGGGGTSTLVAGGLPSATGLVVGADGALYVSVNGSSAGNGAVWRIEP